MAAPTRLALFALLPLLACAEGEVELSDDTADDTALTGTDGGTTDGGAGTTDGGSAETTVDIALPDGPVLATGLLGAPALSVDVVADGPWSACALTLSAETGDGDFVFEHAADLAPGGQLSITWDGTADGAMLPPSDVWLSASADCDDGSSAAAQARLLVISAVVESVDFDGEPLAFHKLDPNTAGISIIEAPEYLDLGDGPPASWEDPWIPPWGAGEPGGASHNVPAAFVAGETPTATVALAVDAPDGDAPIRLVGQEMLVIEPTTDEGVTTLERAEPLPLALGRSEETLTWRLETQVDGAWVPVPGHLETTHRYYLVADPSYLLDGAGIGASPDVAWIGVLEEIDAAISGVEPETAAVLDALRDFVYTNPDYVYNPNDRSYSTYEGDYAYWDWIGFEMTQWLEHSGDPDMYCHSTSCLLSVLAATVGVDAPQYVLGHYFDTNLVLPAGSDDWSTWSFYSHSVTSPDGGATIWDAAVMLDGDGDPWSYPVTPVPASGVPVEDYFYGLTRDDIDVVHTTSCYLF